MQICSRYDHRRPRYHLSIGKRRISMLISVIRGHCLTRKHADMLLTEHIFEARYPGLRYSKVSATIFDHKRNNCTSLFKVNLIILVVNVSSSSNMTVCVDFTGYTTLLLLWDYESTSYSCLLWRYIVFKPLNLYHFFLSCMRSLFRKSKCVI